jgi:hypothetical protein
LFKLASNNPPISASHIARIIGLYHHAWPCLPLKQGFYDTSEKIISTKKKKLGGRAEIKQESRQHGVSKRRVAVCLAIGQWVSENVL